MDNEKLNTIEVELESPTLETFNKSNHDLINSSRGYFSAKNLLNNNLKC